MPRIFLTNQLLVILPADNPGNIQDVKGLSNPGLTIILAAEDVPVGKYARQVLGKLNTLYGADFEEKVLMNVVSYENNVKQVVTKVQIGEADAGIVYVSDAVAAPELKTLNIPTGYNILAEYPIAILSGSLQPDLAKKYIEFVFSYDGQIVFQKWGFEPINPCRLCVKP